MKKANSPIAFLVLAALAAGANISGCGNPADDVAPAKVSEAKSVPSPGSGATAPVANSSATSATVARALPKGAQALPITTETSKIEFIGSKVTGKHDGGFKSFSGVWGLMLEKVEASVLSAEIDMNSIWADNDKLTGHLKSPDFFDVAKFPKSTFESTEISKGSTDTKFKEATHTVTGNLMLHGVTKSIQFPAKIAVAADKATLDSEFFLNRKDFQINYPGMANDLIRDEVVIKLAIRGPRKH
jgi:polyisoprenoid-binding protein YceI